MTRPAGGRALATVERSGVIESEHTATVVVVDRDGRELIAGEPDRRFFVRSAAKPFQAKVAMGCGADLPPEHLAVACASHDGDPIHLGVVRSMLETAGLSESDLRCPPARPLSPVSDRRLAVTGDTEPRRLYHNCSGKHAAMLRASRASSWDLDSYLDPAHPLQRRVSGEMAAVGALVDGPVGVDGCGAPVFPVSTRSLARAYWHLMTSDDYLVVRTAMHRFPALVSGVGNHDAVVATDLAAVAKRGAEACLGVAVQGFGAIAIKVWDGGSRAVAPILHATLSALGWIPLGSAERLGMSLAAPVFGGGNPVGAVRAVVDLGEAT